MITIMMIMRTKYNTGHRVFIHYKTKYLAQGEILEVLRGNVFLLSCLTLLILEQICVSLVWIKHPREKALFFVLIFFYLYLPRETWLPFERGREQWGVCSTASVPPSTENFVSTSTGRNSMISTEWLMSFHTFLSLRRVMLPSFKRF